MEDKKTSATTENVYRLGESISFAVGILLVGGTLVTSWPMLTVPAGSHIRPMGSAFYAIIFALMGLPFAALDLYLILKRGVPRVHIISIVLCLSPLPLARTMLALCIYFRGLVLLP